MSVWKRMTSQFYATGGALGLSTDALDQALEEGANARVDRNSVIVRYPDGRESYHHMAIGVRARATKWVNRFNQRATAES